MNLTTPNRVGRALIASALIAAAVVVGTATSPAGTASAAGTPDIVLTKTMPAEVLFGADVPVRLTVTNPGGPNGYNLSFRDVLPAGVDFASGDPAPRELSQSNGTTVLIWDNVADSMTGTTVSLDFTVTYDLTGIDAFDVGDDVGNAASAYVNSNPRLVPRFNPVTGAPVVSTSTGDASGITARSRLVPFEITKSEPSPERELLRGVHDHQTVYTLTVENNLVEPTTGFAIVDFLPAGLEFLGCGGVDNSTVGAVEYPGAGRIDAGAVPTPTNPCPTPSSVTTVTTDPDGPGGMPTAVYTRVEWTTAALATVAPNTGNLLAGESFKIDYVAAIPLRRNVQADLANTTANLDNNTGAYTTETTGELELTNYAAATGDYRGTDPYTDDTYATVTAEDVAIQKSVDVTNFVQGTEPVYTLSIQSSEYSLGTTVPVTVTDTLPPTLDYVSSSITPGVFSTPTVPATPSAADDVITWNLPPFTAKNQTVTITMVTEVRAVYRGQPGRPVSSSDDFTNDVDLATTSTTIIDVDGTTAPTPVLDESSAGISALGPTISKEVATPVSVGNPVTECGLAGTGVGLVWHPDLAGNYRPGDLVCFKLRVDFPSQLDTIAPVVEDFLPAGFTYVDTKLTIANTVPILPADIVVDGSRITYDIGNVDPTGRVFEAVVAARITDPDAARPGDLVGNLMKVRYQNSSPTNPPVFQLREDADVEWGEPVLALTKGVIEVAGPLGNTTYPTPTDGVQVREGETVTYRVTVSNTGNEPAFSASVRDVLPGQIDCGDDVTSITPSGTCGGSDRWIQWDGIDIAAGDSVELTYDVLIPPGEIAPGTNLDNRAGVRTYEGETNGPGNFEFRPANNIDTGLVPNTDRADDPSRVSTALPTFAKTIVSTSVEEAGNNNVGAPAQATVGEVVSYRATIDAPAGATYNAGVIRDTLGSDKDLVIGSLSATISGAAPGTGAGAGFQLIGDDAGNAWRLVLPDPWISPSTSASTPIVIRFDAIVTDVAANVRGATNTNVATAEFLDTTGGALTTLTRTVDFRVVEPDISVAKRNNATGPVIAGQDILYTVDIGNSGAAGVSTAHDTVAVDTVPTQLIVLNAAGGNAVTGDAVDTNANPALRGIWNAAARTITWNVPSLAPGATTSRAYTVRTESPLVASGPLVNNVRTTATSMAGTVPGERTDISANANGNYDATSSSSVAATALTLTKTGTPGVATKGRSVTYTLTATIPANITAFDATVRDVLPAGLVYESTTSITCEEGAANTPCSPNSATPLVSGNTLAWFLGDLTTPAAGARRVTITYVAFVADVPATDSGAMLRNSAQILWNRTDRITTLPTTPPAPGGFDNSSPVVRHSLTTQEPRLTIDKDVSGQVGDSDNRRAKPGNVLTYSVAVANTGSSAAYDVTVSDVISAATPADWAFVYTDIAADGITLSDGSVPTLAWTVDGPIAPGAAVTITYTLTVPSGYRETNEAAGPELTNIADIPSYWGVPQAERDLPANAGRPYKNYDDVVPDVVAIELDLASIGDQLWFDVDGAGGPIKAATDPALAGVAVSVTFLGVDGVLGTGDDEVFPTVTDSNGFYLVANLPGGEYVVTVNPATIPIAGLAPVYDRDAATSGLGDQWRGLLAQDGARRDVDFSYTGTGSIGDTVWFDQNGNGVKEAIEAGLPGVPVTVTWFGLNGAPGGGDDIDYPTTTNAAGVYRVDRLPAGNYGVVMGDAALIALGYSVVAGPIGDLDLTLNNASRLTLGVAEVNLGQDFGYRGSGQIGNRIFLDRNGNFVDDAGDLGVSGVTVRLTSYGLDNLLGGGDDSVFTTVTGPDGAYLFNFLPEGEYRVEVLGGLPAGLRNTVDPDTVTGGTIAGDSTSNVALTDTNPSDLAQDFGYDASSVLGDTVWWDLNRDGDQDPGEPGLAGVSVRATGPNGLVLTTTTDANGFYTFPDIIDGVWTVTIGAGVPAGLAPSFDADGIGTPNVSTVTLSGSNVLQDFGYSGSSSIGDRLWLDLDADGLGGDVASNDGEPGIENVTVQLTWLDPDGNPATNDAITISTVTNANGEYLFPNLPAGEFRVTVLASDPDFPADVSPTFDLDGSGTMNTALATVTAAGPGQNRRGVDFGYNGGGLIGDTIWFDRNGDGVRTVDEPGLGGVDVTLSWFGEDGDPLTTADNETFTTTTRPDGTYDFSGLPTGRFRVTVDVADLPAGMLLTFDPDGDVPSVSELELTAAVPVNRDQDFGYRGVGRIGDTLYFDRDGNGTQGVGEPGLPGQSVTLVWASPDGPRTFVTSTGPDGSYLFENLPDGAFTVTVTGPIATAAVNSGDPDLGNDSTSAVTLAGGSSDVAQDFGYRGDNRLGDRVWWDQNADGVDDPTEPGIGGITVSFTWFGPDGVAGTPDDVTLGSTTTALDGSYSFDGLPDGNYVVAIGAGIPTGLDRSTFDADDLTASPDNRSILIGLGVGIVGAAENLGQDFGITGTGSIGDTIWLDLDGDGSRDPGEPGIPGALVTLTWYGADGVAGTPDDVVLPTQTTLPDGRYLFEHLPAGSFRVDVANIPAGVSPSADPDGGADSTSVVALTTGQSNLVQDFGYVGTASVGDRIWLDLDRNGLQDANEPGVPGVTVTVRSPGADGVLGTADDLVVQVDTDASGVYVVEGLPAGITTVSYDVLDLGAGLRPRVDLDGGDLTTATVALATGDDIRNVDFGVAGNASVSGSVWIDLDNDGVRDQDEKGIPGVTVNVTWAGPNGPIVITVVTDANGNWAIAEAPPGQYIAVVDSRSVPPGLVRTTPSSSSTTVPPGGSGSMQHGLVPGGSIGDRIWNDTDRNGVQDADETGVPGVTVVLRNGQGAVVATTSTDANGDYRFGELPPGSYTVEVDTSTLPSGVIIVADPDGVRDGRNTVTLGVGQVVDTVDFGVASATPDGILSAAGSEIAGMLGIGALLLVLGLLMASASRRRRGAIGDHDLPAPCR